MSIKSKSAEELKELQDTLKKNPHILEVHFTESGSHYFDKSELTDTGTVTGKGTGRYFGFLSTKVVIRTDKVGNKRAVNVSVENPEAEIVETLTREEVLGIKQKKQKNENDLQPN